MYSIQEKFKTDALAQMNGRVRDAQAIAGNLLDLSREIGVLNLRTTQASAGVLASAVQKLMAAGNPGEFLQIAASVMRPDMQLWTSYIEQLGSIAGKAGLPAATSLALTAKTMLAPQPMPDLTSSGAESSAESDAEKQAAPVAPVAELPMEQALGSIAPHAATPPVAASEVEVDEALPAAPETRAETVEVVEALAEVMTGRKKTPPAVVAASTSLADAPVVPEIAVPRKSAATRRARKPAAKSATSKAASGVRSASGRARKG